MKKSLLAISAVAVLSLGTVAPAMAYPAGQAPSLSLSSVSRLTPGDNISVVVARVKSACSVSVGWVSGSAATASATVGSRGRTPVMTIATPSTAGAYTLRTTLSNACAGDGEPTVISRSVTVGKFASVTAKLRTTSGYVSKNPTVSITGTVKSGSLAVASKSVSVSLRKTVGDVTTTVGTISPSTNGSGVFTANFTGITYTAGSYTAVVSFVADATYAAKTSTTAVLKLR